MFQLGTELVTPTDGWLDVPTDGAVTVPVVCPELPYVPCCAGTPGLSRVLLCEPADVWALAASGTAANPSVRSVAIARLVLVMTDPFERVPLIVQVEPLVH
ncbi:hypothetical protein SAMN05192541_101763 [Bradyrhizobium arachidis]|nr:hypothetical protein SAMN05192541_101763 [Bradyrhizobium arachidis]